MCTITEESTLRLIFLGIYIFVYLSISLLEVYRSQQYTFPSDTLTQVGLMQLIIVALTCLRACLCTCLASGYAL